MRIFGPALVGAAMQLAAVVLTTTGFYILARNADLQPPWPLTLCEPGTSCGSATYLVRWSYLLMAIGVALTNHPFIARTAEWLRATSQPKAPPPTLKVVAAQLLIACFAGAIEVLETPPEAALALGRWVGGRWLGAILWPAFWSIVVAGMGASAHAIVQAMPEKLRDD